VASFRPQNGFVPDDRVLWPLSGHRTASYWTIAFCGRHGRRGGAATVVAAPPRRSPWAS